MLILLSQKKSVLCADFVGFSYTTSAYTGKNMQNTGIITA